MSGKIFPIANKMQLKKLVSENKTDEVFESLMALFSKIENKTMSNAIINLSAQFKRFSDQALINTTNAGQQSVLQAGLNNSIPGLIDELPEEIFGEYAVKRKIDLNDGASDFERNIVNKGVMIVFLILLSVSVICFLSSVIFLLTGAYGMELIKMLLGASFAILIASIMIYITVIKPQR